MTLIAEKEFQQGKKIRMEDIAKETGIRRTTLSKIANQRGYNTTTDVVARLCHYFDGCQAGKLLEYVPDEEVAGRAAT